MQIRICHIFLALCFCTALLACSDEAADPTHADLCKNGVSVECLLGDWVLKAIEKKPGDIHTSDTSDVGGRTILNFSKEKNVKAYVFDRAESPRYHYGSWELDSDSTITFVCIDGTNGCPSNKLGPYKIKVEIGGDFLRIYESPFLDYDKIPNPIEKYQFL